MINRKVTTVIAIAAMILLQSAAFAFETRGATGTAPLPFKGNAEGTITGVSAGAEGVTLTGSAEGQATHLGQYTREEQLLLNPVTGTFTGTMIFTAANGDQLWCTIAGNFISATDAIGIYTFSGGTGRFEQATGEADFLASLPDGVHYTVEFDGVLEK